MSLFWIHTHLRGKYCINIERIAMCFYLSDSVDTIWKLAFHKDLFPFTTIQYVGCIKCLFSVTQVICASNLPTTVSHSIERG